MRRRMGVSDLGKTRLGGYIRRAEKGLGKGAWVKDRARRRTEYAVARAGSMRARLGLPEGALGVLNDCP